MTKNNRFVANGNGISGRLLGILGLSAAVICVAQCQQSGPTMSTAPTQATDVKLVTRVSRSPSKPFVKKTPIDRPSDAGAQPGELERSVDAERGSNISNASAAERSLEQFAQADPLGFAEYCLQRCRESVKDYRCTFVKREKIGGAVLDPQVVDVRFRSQPYSVDMEFVENVRSCARALYVEGKWTNDDNEKLAWVKPGGAILRALVPKIKQPIHGPRAEKESRRTIDQFGFERTLELIVKYAVEAKAKGELGLRYVGIGEVDGRPTFVFERNLPYTGEEFPYPDNILVYHIDQEYLMPVSCQSYADEEATDLLGSYVYQNVELNVGYHDSDFDPDLIDF